MLRIHTQLVAFLLVVLRMVPVLRAGEVDAVQAHMYAGPHLLALVTRVPVHFNLRGSYFARRIHKDSVQQVDIFQTYFLFEVCYMSTATRTHDNKETVFINSKI